MEFHPGRSLHIHNILCKNVIVSVFVVMLMLPSILVNISLSPLSHSPPKLSLIFPKYLSLASTRLGSEHLSMKWASSPNGVSAQNVHVRCDLGFCCILPSSMGRKCADILNLATIDLCSCFNSLFTYNSSPYPLLMNW